MIDLKVMKIYHMVQMWCVSSLKNFSKVRKSVGADSLMLVFSSQHSWEWEYRKGTAERDPLSGDKWGKTGSWRSMNDKCRFDEPNSLNQKKVSANFPSNQHNVTFPFLQSLTFKSNIKEFIENPILWVAGERSGGARSFFLSSASFHFHFVSFVFVSLLPVGIRLLGIIIFAHCSKALSSQYAQLKTLNCLKTVFWGFPTNGIKCANLFTLETHAFFRWVEWPWDCPSCEKPSSLTVRVIPDWYYTAP